MSALHMSAFRGKADMTIGTCPLSRSVSGVKQTCVFALHMSANDPKRTSADAADVLWTVTECCAETTGSIRLYARELHHLAPFRGFFGDQFPEIGRRA